MGPWPRIRPYIHTTMTWLQHSGLFSGCGVRPRQLVCCVPSGQRLIMSGLGRRDDRGYDQGFLPGGTTPFGANRRYCWLTAEAKRNGGSRILELGWGPGAVAEVLAIDISDKFLNR